MEEIHGFEKVGSWSRPLIRKLQNGGDVILSSDLMPTTSGTKTQPAFPLGGAKCTLFSIIIFYFIYFVRPI